MKSNNLLSNKFIARVLTLLMDNNKELFNLPSTKSLKEDIEQWIKAQTTN